jgi:hypothetical protein
MHVKHGLAAGVLLTVAVGCTSGPPSSAVTGDGSPAAASLPLPPSASPSPAPSPSQTPARSLRPQPSAVPGAFPPVGELAIGRHEFSQNGVSFSLEVPTTGWTGSGVLMAPDGGSLSKDEANATGQKIWMLLWSIDGVYPDPCGQVPAPPVSPSATDLAAAVASIPGFDLIAGPEDVTLGGQQAKHITIKLRDDIGCPPGDFFMWYDDVRCNGDDPCQRWATASGQTNDVWIVETQGTHVWIEVETRHTATPETLQEVQQVIGSIQFE